MTPAGVKTRRASYNCTLLLEFFDRSVGNHWAVLNVTVTVTSQFGMVKFEGPTGKA